MKGEVSSPDREAGQASARLDRGRCGADGHRDLDTHSTQYRVQENLAVTPDRTIRSLRITVTVSGGSSVTSTGIWTTIGAADLATTVTRVPGGLVYEVTLRPGQSLRPAGYRFGFQFNRPAKGHDFALDTYTVTATGADGTTLHASGGFGG